MKPIEIILRDANNDNLENAISVVETQINYYRANNVDPQGISLMTVLDLLDASYNCEALRKSGYILTLADFQSDAAKFLRLSAENPIIYNTQLKRLFRSYGIFKEKYLKGLVFNREVVDEVSKQFAETMLTAYTASSTNATALPTTLAEKITHALATEASKFNANWLASRLHRDTDREYTNKLSQRLLKLWENDGLPENIARQLVQEKSQINNVGALTKYFHDMGLPEDAMEAISKQIIEDIIADTQSGKLTTNSALGALISHNKATILMKGDYNRISPILKSWHKDNVADDVARELEKYIQSVIESLREGIIAKLSDEFSQLTVKQFLTGVRNGKYDHDVCTDVQKLTGDLAKEVLLVQDPSKHTELAESLKQINHDAMTALHNDWIQGRLTQAENTFVSDKVFAQLDDVAAKIQANIWISQVNADTADMRAENTALRKEVAKLSEENFVLATEVQDLKGEFAAIKAMLTGKAANTAETKATPGNSDSKDEARAKGFSFFQ